MYKRSWNKKFGKSEIYKREDSFCQKVEIDMLRLAKGDSKGYREADKEYALVILGGKCTVSGEGFEFKDAGKRETVFDGAATCIYVPANKPFTVTGVSEDVQICVCKSPSTKDFAPAIINPEDVVIKNLGKPGWEREAHFILDERVDSNMLYIGEAFVKGGQWASYPPHKHDDDNMPTEAETEETATETATEETATESAQVIETQAPVIVVPATEAAKETVAVPVVEEKVEVAPTVTYTDVVYKDAYNTYKYSTLEEAKANINVNTLTDAQAKAEAAANKAVYSVQVNELVSMINAYRTANGLPELSYNDNLTNAAMHRAAESAYADWNMTAKENGTKRHIRPNFEKASSIGAEYGITGNFGENYGRYHTSTTEILEGWQNSSAHNALLLSDKYTNIGIGIAKDSAGYFYWIAIFN